MRLAASAGPPGKWCVTAWLLHVLSSLVAAVAHMVARLRHAVQRWRYK